VNLLELGYMRAIAVRSAQSWSDQPIDKILLGYDDRHRRRMTMTSVSGLSFLLDLPEAVVLRNGDALELEDGRLIEVVAAAEPLLEIRCTDHHHLTRVAWHLGNRHLPTEIGAQHLRIRHDPVIAGMVRGLGARVIDVDAPFEPESGAYVASPVSGGGHSADVDHHHHHHHHDQIQGHVHGDRHGDTHHHDCGCGQDHHGE
jgi:urease accessory protein